MLTFVASVLYKLKKWFGGGEKKTKTLVIIKAEVV